MMDRNQIIELIKTNRIQEALRALEKATKGSHLHNQIISISASYSEYTQLNRTSAEDLQTLDVQRNRITKNLLSVLDELSPEDFDKVETVRTYHSVAQATPFTSNTPSTLGNKSLLYGVIGVLALAVSYFAFLRDGFGSFTGKKPAELAPTVSPINSTLIEPTNTKSTADTSNKTTPPVVKVNETALPAGITTKPIQPPVTPIDNKTKNSDQIISPPNTVPDISNINYVELPLKGGGKTVFNQQGTKWMQMEEEMELHYTETKRENGIIYLHSEMTNENIQLNLVKKQMWIQISANGSLGLFGKISNFGHH